MIELIDLTLLLFLSVVAVAVVRLRNLFAVVLVMGFYSLVCAALFPSWTQWTLPSPRPQ